MLFGSTTGGLKISCFAIQSLFASVALTLQDLRSTVLIVKDSGDNRNLKVPLGNVGQGWMDGYVAQRLGT